MPLEVKVKPGETVVKVEDYDVVEYIEGNARMLYDLVEEHCDCSQEVEGALEDTFEGVTRDDHLVRSFESMMESSMQNERETMLERLLQIARRFSVRGA